MSAAKLESHADPQEPPYFYLSYARADDESSMHDFFTDLSYAIRFKAKLTSNEVVGRWNTSQQERDEALRTGRVMIALLSPAYFSDEAALFEWKIFELRRRRTLKTSHLSNRETLQRSIIPVCWSPYSGSMPVEISQTPLFDGNLKSGSNVTGGVKSLAENQYAAFVKSLAHYIIQVTSSFQLTPLEKIPDEVSNAFETLNEPTTNSQITNTMPKKILNQNFVVFDSAFAKSLVEQVRETPVSTEEPASSRTEIDPYSVFVIDDEPTYAQRIKNTGDFSREFNVTDYTDANQLLNDVIDLYHDRREPDLIVLNPEHLIPGTGGNLMGALLDEEIPSAILAISQNPDAARSLGEAGIDDLVGILQKPFDSVDVLPLMRRWAELGRDKRHRRGRSEKRRAFLSYTQSDEAMASRICKWLELREIAVWYTVTTMKPGDSWKDKVAQGLVEAEVFMPLISNDYPPSEYCHSELGIVLDRLKREAGNLRVIPILYNSPTTALEDSQIKACLNKHAVSVTDDTWMPGFKQIRKTVQEFLQGQT